MDSERNYLIPTVDFGDKLEELKKNTIHFIKERTPENINDFDLVYKKLHGSLIMEISLTYKKDIVSSVEICYLGENNINGGRFNCAELNFDTEPAFEKRGYLTYLLGITLKMVPYVPDCNGNTINLFYFMAENIVSGYIGHKYGFLPEDYNKKDSLNCFETHKKYRFSMYFLDIKDVNFVNFDSKCKKGCSFGPIILLLFLLLSIVFRE
jgi:hypothetical protein